jgi:hypothetical protein
MRPEPSLPGLHAPSLLQDCPPLVPPLPELEPPLPLVPPLPELLHTAAMFEQQSPYPTQALSQ